MIAAIAMTEPSTGSDLQGIRTSGRKVDGGWVVNGSKTFITSGIQSDLVVVVTGPIRMVDAMPSASSSSSGTCRGSPAGAS